MGIAKTSFRKARQNRSLALGQINLLLGRIFALAAPLIGLQMLSNGLAQFAAGNLDPFWFWLNWILLAASYLWASTSIWFFGFQVYPYQAIVLTTFFALATWGFQLGSGSLAQNEQPWIWWSLAVAGIAAIGGFHIYISAVVLVALPVIWFALQVSEVGLPVDSGLALRDSMFTFLSSTVIGAFIALLRYEAANADRANYEAGKAAIELTKTEAVIKERDRIDALVHDSVLTALIVAANSKTQEQELEAKSLAVSAINRLKSSKDLDREQISIISLFRALQESVHRIANQAEIQIDGASNYLVPGEVAAAFTDSTLQAVSNALQHAGKSAKVSVFLSGQKTGFKVVVKDDGRGFRPSRVAKNRLGIALSMHGRLAAVQGKVFIDSKIGSGTNVVMKWSDK